MDGEVTTVDAIHVKFVGLTATFRIPYLVTGTRLSLEAPPYSTVRGIVQCCIGWNTAPGIYRAGYSFRYSGRFVDLERTQRLELDKSGRIRRSKERGLAYHESLTSPVLDIYIDRPDWYKNFKSPDGTPLLGRSQDVAWIQEVRKVKLSPAPEGFVRGTLIPYHQPELTGKLVRLVDRFENETTGHVRTATSRKLYHVVPKDARFLIRRRDLFHPSDSDDQEEVIYLHSWSE